MKLLAAIDRSSRDRLVLDQCVRMATGNSASVSLVHVVSLPRTLVPGTVREAEAYLEAVKIALAEEGVSAESEVRKGDVHVELIRAAEERDSEILLLSTHGRKGLDRFALGSVAEALLSTCPRPVLVINEATHRRAVNEQVQRKSGYLASVIWAKRARGECSEEQANEELARLAAAGLDRNTLFSTYQALASNGLPPDWLDINFQLRTLAEYLPADVTRTQAGDESAASAA